VNPQPKSRARWLGGIVVRWAGLLGLWILVVGVVSKQELVLGAAAAALTVVGARLAASVIGVRFALPSWWRWALARLPKQVFTDSILLFGALRRALRGDPPASDLVPVTVPDAGDGPGRPSKLAFAVLVLSTPPNTIVVDEDGDRGFVLHRLVPTGDPSELLRRGGRGG
jgi:hypothetical protein